MMSSNILRTIRLLRPSSQLLVLRSFKSRAGGTGLRVSPVVAKQSGSRTPKVEVVKLEFLEGFDWAIASIVRSVLYIVCGMMSYQYRTRQNQEVPDSKDVQIITPEAKETFSSLTTVVSKKGIILTIIGVLFACYLPWRVSSATVTFGGVTTPSRAGVYRKWTGQQPFKGKGTGR